MLKTQELEKDLGALEANTTALETKINHLDQDLRQLHKQLNTSKVLYTKLKELDSNLKLASQLLGIVRVIPTISAAASNTKRIIDQFRKPVAKATNVAQKVEKKVKPVREKVKQVQKQVAKVDAQFKRAAQEERQILEAVGRAQHCVSSLPAGLVKDRSVQGLETLSGKVDPPVVAADKVQVSVLKTINDAEKQTQMMMQYAKGLVDIDMGIDEAMKVLNPFISALGEVQKALKQVIRVPYAGYPKMCKKKVWPGIPVYYPCGWETQYFSFSIQQILDGVTGVIKPVMDLLDNAMNAVLSPLLKALNLNIKLPDIPGLDRLESFINSIASTFTSWNKALANALSSITQLQKELESVFSFLAPLQKVYSGCVAYKGEDRPLTLAGRGALAPVDPEIFDAMCVSGRTTFIFKGSHFWKYSARSAATVGPELIQGQWGEDDRGKAIQGPFDAACVVGKTFYFFRGTSYWKFSDGRGAGPAKIKGNWGKMRNGRNVLGPFSAACVIGNKVIVFKGQWFWVTFPGAKKAQGPFPIEGVWGSDGKGKPLAGPFDAVAVHGKSVCIRKGKLLWKQPLAAIRRGLSRVAHPG